MEKIVNVIGAGLAGSEASYQLAKRSIKVRLFEMKRIIKNPAQQLDSFAELVCSNSFRSSDVKNAVGLMKEELRMMDSLIIRAADNTKVKAGASLSVDRELFSLYVTKELEANPLIEIINEEVSTIPTGPTIIAAGPLASLKLTEALKEITGEEYLHFYDAIAPIISKDGIDFKIAYLKSRWDKGSPDYINCPFTKEEYLNWYNEVIASDRVQRKPFEYQVFEGCMPFEEMAERGVDTLRFGPMKPVGLYHDGIKPYAVVQLRKDNLIDSLYNIVGFQTKLTYPAQDKIIRMIPGLKDAKIVRHGEMHRNTFICAPGIINASYQTLKREDLFIAGQIAGVEGYVESTASGLVAGINMARYLNDLPLIKFPKSTAIGSQANYLEKASKADFEPMNTNYGIFMELSTDASKEGRKEAYSKRAIHDLEEFKNEYHE